MSIYGVVSEFNPFHNGHKYLFNAAKDEGAEKIVCVMSGNTVQRGEFAITDKYTRARAALECGADLVLELPFPWCSASAEYFAGAAIYILSFFADTVYFGSESGDAALLARAAEIALSPAVKREYLRRLNSGEGAAAAYFDLLEAHGVSGLSSNDILGTEYIKAAKRLGIDIDFRTVRRVGAGYLEESLDGEFGAFQSASGIRRALRERGGVESVAGFLPEASFEVLKQAYAAGDIFDPAALSKFIPLFFALSESESFAEIAEADGGVAERLTSAARVSLDASEMLKRAKTKRYTDSKLRRAVLFCLAGVTRQALADRPAYVNLLAANAEGREILSSSRRKGGITVITKPSDAPRNTGQFSLTEKIDLLFVRGLSGSAEEKNMLKKLPYIKN